MWMGRLSERPNGTTYEYDVFGNLTAMIDAGGNFWAHPMTAAAPPISKRGPTIPGQCGHDHYDGALQKSVTDPRGLITTYNHDAFGNVASIVASDGGITALVHDALNRLKASTDPLSRTTSCAYDAADHVVSTMNPG